MKILMVCLGNICRSPLAQGILENKIKEQDLSWEVDCAGTSAYHIGDQPDVRSIAEGSKHNIDITSQRARQFVSSDLDKFDLILVMDSSNFQNARSLCTDKSQEDKIKLILNYVYPEQNMAVPDPYYDNSFANVYDLLDRAIDALISTHVARA